MWYELIFFFWNIRKFYSINSVKYIDENIKSNLLKIINDESVNKFQKNKNDRNNYVFGS